MISLMEFRERLRSARKDAGISQTQLARDAHTSQSRVSSYEAGVVVPTEPTQVRLLEAARPLPSVALDRHRSEILSSASRHKVSNVRVFGSVARGQDTRASDVDLLVTADDGASLFDLVAFAQETEDIVGCPVDVLSDWSVTPDSSIAHEALSL